MCGIVAVLTRPSLRPPLRAGQVLASLDAALAQLGVLDLLSEVTARVEEAAASLGGFAGVKALLGEPTLAVELARRAERLEQGIEALERRLDTGTPRLDPSSIESANSVLVRLKDATWGIRHDRLSTADAVADLAGEGASESGLAAFTSIQIALSAIDRLEVRGRDSAGLHVLVTGHGLEGRSGEIAEMGAARLGDRLFRSLSVHRCGGAGSGGALAFVYKAAAEIGELGENTRRLREAIRGDALLHRALEGESARAQILGHTRWASVGIISEANAHPLHHQEEGDRAGPYVAAVLNGDVDNHIGLRATEGLRIPPEVTTDAKVIPALVSRKWSEGGLLEDAFRATVTRFEGSVAIAACAGEDPGRLLLALRGSGQALYVGLAADMFVVASEPYGLIEQTSRYLRMDGERGSPPGQLVLLDADRAGTLQGMVRMGYDGTPLPVVASELQLAEITTRDIDRRGFPHFLLKEVSEAPASVRKTLRGKLVDDGDHLRVVLSEEMLPELVRRRLADGTVRRVKVVGQGTAAVAGEALAWTLGGALRGSGIAVEAEPATELSGFGLDDDMTDTLLVAISQSGTTTDTNRTVDLLRARGAAVLGIVNRRHSDLVEKVHGVLYTSDGRDVEMAVPSTKAFYAQVVAGLLLAVGMADAIGRPDRGAQGWLRALRDLPQAMEDVLLRRKEIARIAQAHAPARRHWAVVGNGPNRIAAAELRIKLSELCYKSIALDSTEDKKHIDLSAEPLVLVCATGLSAANADDVSKEVAIYRAHRAAPLVIADDGESRFDGALEVMRVPLTHPHLAFILTAMVGHLFGYEAAVAIDTQARPLREMRAVIDELVSVQDGDEALARLRQTIAGPAAQFLGELREGLYDGHLGASAAVRLAGVLRFAQGESSLDTYEPFGGRAATPGALLEDLASSLTEAIDLLTRPVDAIKHQAKTVTVGISRSEEALYRGRLVEAVLSAGSPRERLGYSVLRALAALEPAVADVAGFTRYRIDGEVGGEASISVLDQGGIARGMPSRTSTNPALRGTKHRAATLRAVVVARGGADGRPVILVPETRDARVLGLTLLQADFRDRLPAGEARAVLAGYLDRLDALVDAVTETETTFDEAVLGEVGILDLLTQPVHALAASWRRGGHLVRPPSHPSGLRP